MNPTLHWLLPWEFAPSVLLACAGALLLYLRGWARLRGAGERVTVMRAAAFVLGVALMYAVTQTRFDYLSQYMFFVHRGQHLVLHHLAPFLIALAAPGAVLAAGLPVRARGTLGRLWRAWPVRISYRVVQQPAVASLLFVGLIYFWLIPSIHFDAMLSRDLYWLMNWSMAVDGLLFWWVIFAAPPPQGPAYGTRIAMLVFVMFPQIALGAYIAFSDAVLFEVYAVCGRAWPLAPLTDQQVGGLITWIPPAMMSVLAALIVLGRLLRFRS